MERNALMALVDRPRLAQADVPAIPPEPLTARESQMLSRAQKWYPLREDGESVKATLLGVVRAVALELGRRLESAGQLPRASLVQYLTISELLTACAGVATVPDHVIDLRVQARENAAGRVPRPELGKPAKRNPDLRWLPEPSRRVHKAVTLLARNEILSGVRAGRDQLVGRPAAPGIHSGRVRIITEPGQLQCLMAGDVIVAATASSAWSSAFLTAGALVTEAGGLLSHAAIVARELNLPAVVGVDRATTILTAGDWITVDGNGGTVIRRKVTPSDPTLY
jgi:phosphohistidine swiveling domain-containing protein